MSDKRRLYYNRLGDAISDTLATLSTAQQSQTQAFNASVQDLVRNQEIRPSPYTDYSGGMLNGWIRAFSANGYTSIPAPNGPGTLGPAPSATDWQSFDSVANQLGVGGFVASQIKASQSQGSNFFDKVGQAINTALVQIDQTVLRPAYQPVAKTTAQAVAVLDKYVPGWSTLIDVLYPIVPFVPALVNGLAAASGISTALTSAALDSVTTAARATSTATLGNVPLDKVVAPLDAFTQNAISNAVTYAARVGATNANAVASVQATLAKALATASTTRGNAVQKLEAAGVEAAHGVILALQVAAAVIPGGQAAGPALQALALALQASLQAATATGDATQILEQVGLTIAKGIPAILTGFALTAVPASISNTTLVVGGDVTTAVDASGVVTTTTIDPLFTTTLGRLISGIATLEATAISTGASVAQVALAANAMKAAAAQSRKNVTVQAQALDSEIARLQKQLAQLKSRLAAQGKPGVPATVNQSSPLATLALVAIGVALLREVR